MARGAALTDTAVEAPSTSNASQRLTSVDVFRGLTIAGMLLVNDPGDAAHVFAPLRHSVWHGWTPTDLIFPFFLFLVGVTTHLSLAKRAAAGESDVIAYRAALRRAAIIFALGLFVNAFPFYQSGAIAGVGSPNFLDRVAAKLLGLRLLGVLQRIAIAYFVASLVVWRASARRVALVTAALLLGYWGAMTLLPVPGEGAIGARLLHDPARTLSAWVDRTTLDWTAWGGGFHLWTDTRSYDPEGLFSTIPAIGSVLLGTLAARWLTSPRPMTERLSALCAAGALAMTLGAMWNWVFPINKPIWTSSYALFTAGIACLALGTVAWLVDVARWDRWARPFVVYGTNPILAYVGAELLSKVLHSTIKWKLDERRVGTEQAFTLLLQSFGLDPRVASLAWALLFVALWYWILKLLYDRRIFLRV